MEQPGRLHPFKRNKLNSTRFCFMKKNPTQVKLNLDILNHTKSARAGSWRFPGICLAIGMIMAGWPTPSAHAQPFAWDTAPGSANFSGANWTSGTVAGTGTATIASGDSLYFGTSSTTALNNDEPNYPPFTIAGITFNSGASTFTFSGDSFGLAGGITNNSTATETIYNNITLTGTGQQYVVQDVTGSITFGGVISDGSPSQGNGLTFPGYSANGKTITITNVNTYSGPTIFGGNFGGANGGNAFDYNGYGGAPNSVFYQGVLGSGNATYYVSNPNTGIIASGTIQRSAGYVYNGVALGGSDYHNFTINGSSAGNTIESFGALTLASGWLDATFVPNAAGNIQVLFSSVTRNPGTMFYAGRSSTAPGGNAYATATSGANVVFTSPPTMVGNSTTATGTPDMAIVPGFNVGNNIAVYDSTYGLRTIASSEQATFASGMALNYGGSGTSGQNAVMKGNVTLSANTTVNSLGAAGYTITMNGNTLYITSGVIDAGVGPTIGASAGDGVIALGSAEGIFITENTRKTIINSVITGSGGLTIALDDYNGSTAYCTLNGANTYTGPTRVIGNNAAMTLNLDNSLAIQNSMLDYNYYGAAITFGGSGVTSYTLGGLQGAQNLPSIANLALTIGGAGSNTTYSGVITGSGGSLTIIGPGSLALTGASTYTGGTTLSSGQLNINYGGSSSANSAIGTGTLTLQGGTFDNTSGSTVILAPNNAQKWNGNFTFQGSSSLILGTGAVTLLGNSQVTVNGSGTLTVGGAINGAYSLTMNGSGTLALTNGNNDYTGNTIINGGGLALIGSGSINNSPIIQVSSGGRFDVSGVSSTFTLATGQKLYAGGGINGSVTASSGSAVYPGTDGTYGTNTFTNSLTLANGATANFDLGTEYNGANDLLVVDGSLALSGNILHIKAPSTNSVMDTNADYTLFTVASGISGTFSSIQWDVQPVNYLNFTVTYSANAVKLHYTSTTPPDVTSVTASPTNVTRGGTTFITADVTAGSYPIKTVTVSGAVIVGGSVQLFAESAGVYTNNVTISATAPAGVQTLTATATDNPGNTGTGYGSVNVQAATATWSGNGLDGYWSDNNNWVGNAGPLGGDAVVFPASTAGPLQLTMDQNYTLGSVTFSSGASSFVQTNSGNSVLTLNGSGVVNNSANAQVLNMPINMSTGQTFNVAAGNITLGGVVNGASLTETGTNVLTLAGANGYIAGTTVDPGTLVVANNSALGSGPLTMAGGSLSNSAGVSYSVANNITLSGPVNVGVGSGDTFTLSGQITGGGELTEVGSGALFLQGANNNSGGVVVSSGATLIVGNNSSVGLGLLTLGNNASISNYTGGGCTLANTVNVSGAANVFVGTGSTFTLSGLITNTGSLALVGAGTVSIVGVNVNTYSGGTSLNSGTLDVENTSVSPLGTGTLTFAGGTLEDNNLNAGTTISNNITVVTNTTTHLHPTGWNGLGLLLAGNISGPGNIEVDGSGTTYDSFGLSGTNSGFTGTLTVDSGGNQRFLFDSASAGSPNAAFVLNSAGTDEQKFGVGTGTIYMGSLSGGGWLRNDAGASMTTLSIGGLNTNAVFGGIIVQNGGDEFSVLKVGTGIETFTNNNTYTGSNTVAQGMFEITTAQQAAQNLQVDDGATFGVWDTGSGQTAQVGSMEVGINTGANLFFTNIYAAGATPLVVTSTMTVNGTCGVTLADTANLSQGNLYTLVSYGGGYAGSGNFVLAAPLPGGAVGGLINDPSYNGLFLSLVQATATTTTNITLTVTSPGQFSISWPGNYQGWVLQTNNVGLVESNAWVNVPGSEYTTTEYFTVDPTQTNVYFRLALP
jgi:autotransporter-associated beta strand protein